MKLDEMREIRKLAQGGADMDGTAQSRRSLHQALLARGIDPETIYQELEMSSRYINTHRDSSYSDYPISLHSHTYGELIYCREAENVEYLLGSSRYRLQPGDIIFIPPGVSHRPILSEAADKPYVRDAIWLSWEFLVKLCDIFGTEIYIVPEYLAPLRTSGTKWDFLGELFAGAFGRRQTGGPVGKRLLWAIP